MSRERRHAEDDGQHCYLLEFEQKILKVRIVLRDAALLAIQVNNHIVFYPYME